MIEGPGFVAVSKETGKGVAEFATMKHAQFINTEKYRIVPIMEYLQSLNETR